MNDKSLKFRQLKYKITHGYFPIENVILFAAVAICLGLTYQSIISMSRNWELIERLNAEQKSLELLELEIDMAELENEYYKTTEYQELAARKLANKQAPGEHMVNLPDNSPAAKAKHQSDFSAATSSTPAKEYSNFEKWMMYLFP